jgi:hypothetical protein
MSKNVGCMCAAGTDFVRCRIGEVSVRAQHVHGIPVPWRSDSTKEAVNPYIDGFFDERRARDSNPRTIGLKPEEDAHSAGRRMQGRMQNGSPPV